MRMRGKKLPAGGRGRRGAVALEYILLASFMAIALMGAFAYFRRTLKTGAEEISYVAALETSTSVREAKAKLGR